MPRGEGCYHSLPYNHHLTLFLIASLHLHIQSPMSFAYDDTPSDQFAISSHYANSAQSQQQVQLAGYDDPIPQLKTTSRFSGLHQSLGSSFGPISRPQAGKEAISSDIQGKERSRHNRTSKSYALRIILSGNKPSSTLRDKARKDLIQILIRSFELPLSQIKVSQLEESGGKLFDIRQKLRGTSRSLSRVLVINHCEVILLLFRLFANLTTFGAR